MYALSAGFTGKNSARIIPLLMLIIIPFLLSIGGLIVPEIYAASDAYSFGVIFYGLYAFRYNTRQHFKKIGYENGIIQYEITRRIFYILIPAVILLLAFISTMPTSEDLTSPENIVLGMWIFVFVAGFLRILAYHIRKEFEFYFAKAYIKVASDDENETKKAIYFMKGIKFYDRYLRRIFNLQINDINEIYNRFIFDSNIDNNEEIKLLSLAFENENDSQSQQ
jgi:hypothetical protein